MHIHTWRVYRTVLTVATSHHIYKYSAAVWVTNASGPAEAVSAKRPGHGEGQPEVGGGRTCPGIVSQESQSVC